MPATTGCSCRSRTSSFCPATAPRARRPSSTSSAASPGRSRKARLKKRIRDMAGQLIKIAAARLMRTAPALPPPAGLYDEFAARFPYEETDDQMAAIDAVIDDLVAGRPMDRLICGDVGFGKTEVALRAAFVAAMNGKQVARGRADHAARAPALQDLLAALSRPAGRDRPGLAPGRLGGARRAQEGHRRRHGRHRHRHACAARQGDQVQGPRPADHRRGAAFRRQAQGAAEGAAEPTCTC